MTFRAANFLPKELAAASLGLLFLVTGCGPDGSPANPAKVRVLHASTDAQAFDVSVDSVRLATNAPFGAATGFAEVESGQRRISVATGKS